MDAAGEPCISNSVCRTPAASQRALKLASKPSINSWYSASLAAMLVLANFIAPKGTAPTEREMPSASSTTNPSKLASWCLASQHA